MEGVSFKGALLCIGLEALEGMSFQSLGPGGKGQPLGRLQITLSLGQTPASLGGTVTVKA